MAAADGALESLPELKLERCPAPDYRPTMVPKDITEQSGAHALAFGELDSLVGYHLRRASSAFAIDFGRALSGTGVRQVPLAILSIVADNPGANQGAVGRALGIQRANMVALISDLVARGLIRRKVAPEDRRAFALTVSHKGRSLLNDCLARIAEHEAGMLSELSDAEREILIDLLRRIEAKEH